MIYLNNYAMYMQFVLASFVCVRAVKGLCGLSFIYSSRTTTCRLILFTFSIPDLLKHAIIAIDAKGIKLSRTGRLCLLQVIKISVSLCTLTKTVYFDLCLSSGIFGNVYIRTVCQAVVASFCVQIATEEKIYLFDCLESFVVPSLKDVLQSPDVLKIVSLPTN